MKIIKCISSTLSVLVGVSGLLSPGVVFSSENTTTSSSSKSPEETTFHSAPAVPDPQSVKYKGLEWEISSYSNSRTWEEAVIYCSNLKLGDHSDWRLPTKDELKSLVKCSNGKSTPLADWKGQNRGDEPKNYQLATCCTNYPSCDNFDRPTIDNLFPCTLEPYWSSTIDENNNIWCVNFYDGRSINGYYPEIPNNTRCVRNTANN